MQFLCGNFHEFRTDFEMMVLHAIFMKQHRNKVNKLSTSFNISQFTRLIIQIVILID